MNILFIGDIFASAGRSIVAEHLPSLIQQHQLDLVIANGENSAGGFGITPLITEELLSLGVDVVTGGNHSFDKREVYDYLDRQPRLLRPANYPNGLPGKGSFSGVTKTGIAYTVLNLQGRASMSSIDCPFRKSDEMLAELDPAIRVRFVDFRAELTSEKVAMGWHLDGRVSGVVGTHTHIPTADSRVLPGGTAYITDVGMTGPRGGVIGVRKEQAIASLRTHMNVRFETSDEDPWLMGVVITCCEQPLRAQAIEQVLEPWRPAPPAAERS